MQTISKPFPLPPRRGTVASLCLLITLAACVLFLVSLTSCVTTRSILLPEITVEIHDDAIHLPAEIPAGFVAVTITDHRTQIGDGVPILFRLQDGVSMEEAMAAGEDPTAPPKAFMLGGQVGRTIFQLEAGNYFIQWASEDEQPPAPAVFRVQGHANGLSAPTSDVQLNLVDFNFILPERVPSGKHLWQIHNQGKTAHHALLLKLNEGVSDEAFTTWLMQEQPEGPPPAQLVVHGAPHDPGVSSWPEIDLSPGTYYVVCFLPDFSANPPMPHVAHGMLRKFTVQP